jgi:arylsulfatase
MRKPAIVSMSRRNFLALSASAGAMRGQEKRRPNILLILADDLGYSDLGCYGGEIATPNLDQLATNGVRFTQFYTTARCCPSRASLLTGQYPHRVGVGHMTEDLGQPGYRGKLSENGATIAEVLRPAGYRTFVSGKWHVGTNDPTARGFEEFYW